MKIKIFWIIISLILLSYCKSDTDPQLVLSTYFNEALNEEITWGTYEVAENPQKPEGSKIKIKFIILPARSRNPAPDPVFVFSGGPGQGAADGVEGWAHRLDKLRREREIVLIDQRGTGASNPLPCFCIGDPQQAQTYLKDMFPVDYVERCREELEAKRDLRYYHTVLAIEDTDQIRAALGYDQINLIGVSYGTIFSLVYMNHYPQNVRSAYLDSTAPPNWDYPACLAQDTEISLQRLINDCAADPDCSSDYPDFEKELYELWEILKQGPVSTQITNPINGVPETVTFTHHNFIHIIRSMLYSNASSRWIPAFIYWAYRGIWFPLVEYAVQYFKDLSASLMDGMLLCVTCSETIPYINMEDARQRAQDTFMGTYRINQQSRACELWVRGDLPDGFLELAELNIPCLIFSGEFDPVTPPDKGQIVASYLPLSLHYIIPNSAHGAGQAWNDCLDDVVAQFISQGNVTGLDTSCADSNCRPPFVSWRDYSTALLPLPHLKTSHEH
jgi:pimeloyl-ACP methyl ester carboxylesterase